MGLSAPKKRAKLSHDPNNTAWARNTESFGHKILSSQGWTPGQTLGAEGAAHATHYTAASNSHIRVLLKDDQLGLGASRGANNADTFGLSLFSGILGRLNGKSEVQLEKEQATRRDVELALYQSRKGGFVNFVSAGFLVGDRIDKAELMSKDRLEQAKKEGDIETAHKDEATKKEQQLVKAQGTKRKRADTAPVQTETDAASSSDSHDEEDVTSSYDSSDSAHEDAASKKRAKKNNKEEKHKASSTLTDQDDERATKKASKAERRADKDQRRAEKEKRRADKEERRRAKDAKRADKEERRRKKEAKRANKSAATTPTDSRSGTSTPQPVPFIGRHAVRQRYIAAKGRAHLDPQALKEIFMVKAA